MKKKLLIVFSFLFIIFKTEGQALFGNEWIFDYSKTYYKIKVAQNGLYRIPFNTLQAAGLGNTQGRDFLLFKNGQEVPIFVTSSNLLSNTDYIEFYGEKNDGAIDDWLFKNPQYEHYNPNYSFFTDTAVYFLAVQLSVNHKRIAAAANNTSSQFPETYFLHTATYEDHSSFAGGYNFNLGGGHVVLPSSFDAGEGWFGLFFNSSVTQNISTPLPYTGAGTPGFSAEIMTSSPYAGSNNLGVNINGQYTFPGAYSSSNNGYLSASGGVINYFDVAVNKFTASNISMNAMVNGQTPVNFFINSGGGYQTVSSIKLIYPKQFDFGSQNQEYFQINNSASNFTNKHLIITNFNAQGSDAILYDFDQNQRFVDVNAGGSQSVFNFLLQPSTSVSRNLFLSSDNNVTYINSITPRTFKDYSNSSNQGNYVIITNKFYRNDGTGHDYVKDYGAYRKSILGGGFDTLIANIDDLYDEFAYGIIGNPLAIRNFAHYADYYFTKPKPFHFFLIGKGQEYISVRNNAARAAINLVPTFGVPGSDNLLTGYNNDWFPHIAIGRLSCFNAGEVKTYLDKVKEYERAQTENCAAGDGTLATKDWQKQVIHLSGGATQYDQDQFDGYLNTGYNNPLTPMKTIIEDTMFGANVTVFKKSSSAPIQLSASYKLDSLINTGVSIINFFGHSSFSTLEFAIDNPSSYQNFGKYPLFISNGCFSGNLFDDPALNSNQRGLSERFVVPDAGDPQNIGAIAYISTSDLGISTGLNQYTNTLYKNLAQRHYGNTLGECIRIGLDTLLQNAPYAAIDVLASGEQMLLNGDPAIKINPHSKPDYVIEPSLIALNPSTINFESGNNFHVLFSVENIGKNVKDSINILVLRYFPKADLTVGSTPTLITTLRRPVPKYRDNYDVVVPLNADKALGTNRIQIVVDATNEVNEICENNNQAAIDFNISSLDLLPVYPSQFSILVATDTANFSLKASTIDPLSPARNYFFQFDTTEKFNSSQLQTTIVNQIGGVVSWKMKPNWVNNRVYYWRCAVDTLYGNHTLSWHNSSFTYIYNSSAGWDQSHYYEFKKDDLLTMQIDSATRKFKFANNVRSVKVVDFGDGTSYQVAPFLDYDKLNNGGSCLPYAFYNNSGVVGPFAGFNIVLFDSIFGQPIQNGYGINPQPGDYTCGGVQMPTFQYLTTGYLTSTTWPNNIPTMSLAPNDSVQRTYLNNFLNNFIPNGCYALMYSIGKWSPQTMGTALHSSLHNLFHTSVVDTMTNSRTFVLFGKKGAHSYTTHEIQASSIGGVIDTTFYFSGNWYQGSITSTQIGPVAAWTSMHWSYNPQEVGSADSTSIQLIGVDTSGNETVLYENHVNQQFDYNIGFVNATHYPYLKMRMTTKDTLQRTPAQLNYWRINYQAMPEIALDKKTYFAFHADTIFQGEKITLKYCIRNVSAIKMDSFYVKYTMVKNNNSKDVYYLKMHPINAWDTATMSISIPSTFYPGKNSLLIDANQLDYKHKNELYHFNNTAKMNIVTFSDNINPLLDVTFDGQHIMNGDIVSAKPHITIKLKDENKYLALDTLSLFQLSLKYPGANAYTTISPLNMPIKFTTPTNASVNNQATIELDPNLTRDGTYTLRVQGHDRSNNASGSIDYTVSFTIINKPMISNIINYPNPFTTLTHFVFTLTGSEIPTYFKIQIFTITGKVVKEINIAQLGEGMHIGNNMTQYAWDGTDEYGKPLGNGLYLYRVVTNLSGSKIDHYNTSIDQYFKSGFGKMYLMR